MWALWCKNILELKRILIMGSYKPHSIGQRNAGSSSQWPQIHASANKAG